MGKRKRTSRRSSSLVDRAVSAGRSAFKEAERRLPADMRRQLNRRLKDADKTARAAIKTLQAQVKKASTRADVNTVLKRIDSLTKQARQIAAGSRGGGTTAGRRTSRRPSKAATTRKPAATRKAAATTTRARRPATRRAAPRRRPAASAPAPAPADSAAEMDGTGGSGA